MRSYNLNKLVINTAILALFANRLSKYVALNCHFAAYDKLNIRSC